MNALMLALETIVKDQMSDLTGSSHSFAHVQRVYAIATILAEQEHADMEVVQVGALLHDIGRTNGDPHSQTGIPLARGILQSVNYPADQRDKILNIIAQHDLRGQPKTLEEQIIWDADKLDLLGIIGIVRSFHWAGETHRPFEEALTFCINTLTKIYPLLKTQTAQQLAQHRETQLHNILNMLQTELTLSDLTC
jgi:putative nucleotidyltransferase with HDIG domain